MFQQSRTLSELAGSFLALIAIAIAITTATQAAPSRADGLPIASGKAKSRASTTGSTSTREAVPEASDSAQVSTWQNLLERAEPLYHDSKFKQAQALYLKAAQAAAEAKADPAARIRCLRYLADSYCRLNQPDEAMAQYELVSSLIPATDISDKLNNLGEKAYCLGARGEYGKAEALSQQALKLCSQEKSTPFWELARTQAQLGYFSYMQAKYAPAIPFFEKAEQNLEKSGRSDLAALVLKQKMAFAQGGSYYHLHRYSEAYEQFKRMYELDSKLFGKTNLQTGWAMLAISDVLEKTNKAEESADWYRKAIYVFRKFNRDRLLREFQASNSNAGAGASSMNNGELTKRMNQAIFGTWSAPQGLLEEQPPLCRDCKALANNHDPRSQYARFFTDAPGLVWMNPLVKQHGIVVAIHGLSLEHSSYAALGKAFADEGYTTVAFDVRGFGVYRQALGAEYLDFNECMRDLQLMVHAIREDNKNTPIYILGESMGGAIALQFAAQNPGLVDGLIASVPAGKRFRQRRTAVKVAIHYLENRHRPIDIGTDVINQATHDQRVKEAWAGDPKTRSRLSPQELLAFQSMCNRNIKYAKEIHSMPVVIYQGVSDGLVKPEATYDLFRAIASKDKSLVMVGNAEHLIFEEGCFSQPVIKGLLAWMDTHAQKPEQQSSRNSAAR